MKSGGWILAGCTLAFIGFQNCSKPLDADAPPQKAKLSSTSALSLALGSGAVPINQSILVYATGGKAPFKYMIMSGGGSITATDSQGTSATFFAPAATGNAVIGVTDAAGSSATGVMAIVDTPVTASPTPTATPGAKAIVYRYMRAWFFDYDHVFSLQNNGVSGYGLEGAVFYVWTTQSSGMVGLYSCFDGAHHSVAVGATGATACVGAEGKTAASSDLLGYISTTQITGTQPLHLIRYTDGVATFNASEGAPTYHYEKTLGYTSPVPTPTPTPTPTATPDPNGGF